MESTYVYGKMTCRKKPLVVVGCVLLLILSMSIFVIIHIRRDPKRTISETEISAFLEDGDIICRLGDRIWSLYFKDISPSDKRFSHLGIVRICDGNITVINAEGLAIEGRDSVNEVLLKDFLKIARAVGIYRIKNINGSIISDEAIKYKGFPFDWKFDLTEEDAIYCTELLYVVLKHIKPDMVLKTTLIEEVDRQIIPLDAISNSDDFIEVLYVTMKR
jgi:hypothetical protein